MALWAHGDGAPAGAVGVGEVAVGVEHGLIPVGEALQLIGAIGRGDVGPRDLGVDRGRLVHAVGQLGEEVADDAHVLAADLSGGLCGGGGCQFGWQRFCGQCLARAQVGGFLDEPGGLAAADAQLVG